MLNLRPGGGVGSGTLRLKADQAAQNIHWRKIRPRPLVWGELRLDSADNGGPSMFTPGMCFKHQTTITITTLTALRYYMAAWSPGLVINTVRWPPAPGEAASVVRARPDWASVFAQGSETNVWRDTGSWCLMSRGWGQVRCDQWRGAGHPGSRADCQDDPRDVMMTRDKYADTKADDNDTPHCFTQMNSICWVITQPQHAINFQSRRLVYSRTQYWHTQIHFQHRP